MIVDYLPKNQPATASDVRSKVTKYTSGLRPSEKSVEKGRKQVALKSAEKGNDDPEL